MIEKNYLDKKIRKIPNFPKEGILFYDITTLFEDAEALRLMADDIAGKYIGRKIDKVVGIDARGFLLASILAYKLEAGVAIVRKKGKLPYKTIDASYEKEYGTDTIEMHIDAIKHGETVVVVDDLLATGGTMLATVDLVERLGGKILGLEFVVNLSFLSGLDKLKNKNYPISYLIDYDSETMGVDTNNISSVNILTNQPVERIFSQKIKVGIIGGSGLDNSNWLSGDKKESLIMTPFGQTSSPITEGLINGVAVAILARHGHQHELAPSKVPYRANLWALKELGCTHILATTACGSLRQEIKPSDLVFPDQFIDHTKQRDLTIFEDKVEHTAMAEPFCLDLRKLLSQTANDLGFSCHRQGTVITIEGPRFSTKAESRLFKSWGADIINMSTVPEVIIARELGLCYQAIAMSTDYDAWRDNEESVSWEMIKTIMAENVDKVKKIITEVLPKIS